MARRSNLVMARLDRAIALDIPLMQVAGSSPAMTTGGWAMT
jgi:hypothetical protein